jgi:hypothetical protein
MLVCLVGRDFIQGAFVGLKNLMQKGGNGNRIVTKEFTGKFCIQGASVCACKNLAAEEEERKERQCIQMEERKGEIN